MRLVSSAAHREQMDLGAKRVVRAGIRGGDRGRARRSRWRGWTVPLPLFWPCAARPPVVAMARSEGCIRTPSGLLVTGGSIVTGAGPGPHRGPDHDDWQEPRRGRPACGAWPWECQLLAGRRMVCPRPATRGPRPAGASALHQSLRPVPGVAVSSRGRRWALPPRICTPSPIGR